MRKIFQFNLLSLLSAIWLVAAMLIQYPEVQLDRDFEREISKLHSTPLVADSKKEEQRLRNLRILAMNSQAKREGTNRNLYTSKYLLKLRLTSDNAR